MVAGFFAFWAEVGDIIRAIDSRGRNKPSLIIDLILANRAPLCAVDRFAANSFKRRGRKVHKGTSPSFFFPAIMLAICLLSHIQMMRRRFCSMPTIRFGKTTSTLNAPSPTSSRF
jgi:hypothetical protein